MSRTVRGTVIAQILEVCAPASATSFTWFGELVQDAVPPAAPDPAAGRAALVTAIRECLYTRAFLPGGPIPRMNVGRPGEAPATIVPPGPATSIQPGWCVEGDVPHGLLVRRGRITAVAAADDVLLSTGHASPGHEVAVRIPRVLPEAAPGFVLVLGEHDLAGPPDLRVYLNAPQGLRPAVAEALTGALDGVGVGHRLKVLTDESRGARADGVIVYLARADWVSAWGAVAAGLRPHGQGLVDRVPLFTRRLAPGVAVAEEPGSGESFGDHRCGILAEAIVGASERGTLDAAARLRAALDAFRAAGIDPEAIHRAAASDELPAPPAPHRMTGRSSESGEAAVDVIARRICDAAITSGDRATWLAPVENAGSDGWERYATMSADLYGGTAGLALFLAEHARYRDTHRSRDMALAALRHAIEHAPELAWPGDLYGGGVGVVMAALRVGDLLDVEWPGDWAIGCRHDLLRPEAGSASPDLLGGAAGIVIGLVAAGTVMADDALLGAARTHADALTRAGAMPVPIAGVAHGLSGMALALLELVHPTRHDSYRRAALRAMDAERALFDRSHRNWSGHLAGPGRPPSFVTAWCSGAPGIALVRLRSMEVAPSGAAARDLRNALATTARHLGAQLRSPAPDLSSCHGALGLAEVLLDAGRRGYRAPLGDVLVRRSVEVVQTLVRGGEELPSGVDGRCSPALMLGDAGVGRFLLRVEHPEIPSLLLPQPSRWSLPAADGGGTGVRLQPGARVTAGG
jgi:hypothetical protein